MRGFFMFLTLLLVFVLALNGCASQTSPSPDSNRIMNPSVELTGSPQHGGTLRRIVTAFPKVLGYPEEFAPIDAGFASVALERLVIWDEKGNLIPVLAESWEEDPNNRTITWHLRKGVRFTDGTEWNAEALKWNYESRIRAGRLIDHQSVESLEVIDSHTLKMHLSDYHRMMPHQFGWTVMISPTAFEKAGGGDIEKSKEWARLHPVGTGPFKIVDFQRDVVLRSERNENYWRKGMPYYDGIEYRLIPDLMIASAMIQANEADMLTNSDVRTAIDLERLGFKVNWGTGMLIALLPNSFDPNSPFSDKRVRAAVEYAIDRPALAKMIGYGKYEPITQLAGSDFLGYVPDFDPRPFNPNKAKQLLAEAGYPKGFQTKILTAELNRDLAAALKAYLGDVGIEVDLDIADTARYTAATFSEGWEGLAIGGSGINPDATDIFVHFGADPMTYRTDNIAKSKAYLDLCDEALHTYDDAEYRKLLRRIVRQASEDAMVVPLYITVLAAVMQHYVHSDIYKIHQIIWKSYEDWMSPR